jgi:acetyl-CoA acetyltransferase
VVIAAEDRARDASDRPAWITGIQHRVDAQTLGLRDLTRSESTAAAAAALDLAGVDTAELHAPFSHQELVLRRELGLGDDVVVNPSGGALCGNPMFAAGLIRIGEAAARVSSGESSRAVAHATSGPVLQQNLLCTLEGGR